MNGSRALDMVCAATAASSPCGLSRSQPTRGLRTRSTSMLAQALKEQVCVGGQH